MYSIAKKFFFQWNKTRFDLGYTTESELTQAPPKTHRKSFEDC